jgi:hypothetical protein
VASNRQYLLGLEKTHFSDAHVSLPATDLSQWQSTGAPKGNLDFPQLENRQAVLEDLCLSEPSKEDFLGPEKTHSSDAHVSLPAMDLSRRQSTGAPEGNLDFPRRENRQAVLEDLCRSDPSKEEIALLADLFRQVTVQSRVMEHFQQHISAPVDFESESYHTFPSEGLASLPLHNCPSSIAPIEQPSTPGVLLRSFSLPLSESNATEVVSDPGRIRCKYPSQDDR